MSASTRTMVALVAGLGAIAALSGSAQASAPPAARRSTRPRSNARKPSTAPKGEVTLGPVTTIRTDPKTGKVTKKTDWSDMSDSERAAYGTALLKDQLRSDYKLLTDEQAKALEDESIERARAQEPDAGADQQERALRAARRAAELLGRRSVPAIPRNPTVAPTQTTTRDDDDAPNAYVSPPTAINLELARREAPGLAKHLRAKGIANYSRQSVRDFQSHAGLTVDGLYGPLTANALKYFGVPNPPKAMFKAKPGTVTIYAPAN